MLQRKEHFLKRLGFPGGGTHPFTKTRFVCLSDTRLLVKPNIGAARGTFWPHSTRGQESCEAQERGLGVW